MKTKTPRRNSTLINKIEVLKEQKVKTDIIDDDLLSHVSYFLETNQIPAQLDDFSLLTRNGAIKLLHQLEKTSEILDERMNKVRALKKMLQVPPLETN